MQARIAERCSGFSSAGSAVTLVTVDDLVRPTGIVHGMPALVEAAVRSHRHDRASTRDRRVGDMVATGPGQQRKIEDEFTEVGPSDRAPGPEFDGAVWGCAGCSGFGPAWMSGNRC